MSHVKQLIATTPSWLAYLVGAMKINVVQDGNLVSLKYNQIESPMHEPLVQECRGMVVCTKRNQILAHPYNKFWNHGESLAAQIDWRTASVFEKLDGSLMILYFDPKGVGVYQPGWQVASSGTPRAGGPYGMGADKTYAEVFWDLFGALDMHLPAARNLCFMLELCAPDNRIVVRYNHPRIVLHGARDMSTGRELAHAELLAIGEDLDWEVVRMYPISSIADALIAAEELNPIDVEGFVVVDANFNRVKIKSPRYVILHHMKGDATPRRAIELWQTGETGELLAHFPEMAPQILPIHAELDRYAERVVADLVANAGAPTRKEFAVVIKDKPWATTCFRMYGDPAPSVDTAKELMRKQTLASLERLLATEDASGKAD